MPPRKKPAIQQVSFVKPVYIRFGSVSRPEVRVTSEQVDELDFVGNDFILIGYKKSVTWVPMCNVMSIQLK